MEKLISHIQKLNLSLIKNSVTYTRCSTPKQNTDNMHSLDTQKGICRLYSTMNNYKILEEISEIKSGHDSSKQSYLQILDKYSNINLIIADPSRLSRNVSHAQDFILECLKKNIIIHFVRDNLILNSLQDCKRAINSIYDAFIESSVMSKRITSAIQIRKKLGSHLGQIPFGYQPDIIIDKKTSIKIRKLKKNILEQNIIKIICQMYYGTPNGINSFYKLLNLCTNKHIKIVFSSEHDNSIFTTIYYGNINCIDIMNFLNENNILNRGKYWKKTMISTIIKKYKHDNSLNLY
jgi:DNA invertase Pin-like site-specific DNA recombinase